jgi:hypothetical protein
MAEKNVMVSVRLPQSMVEAVDAHREKTGVSRTEWLTRVITRALAETPNGATRTSLTNCPGFEARAKGSGVCTHCGLPLWRHRRDPARGRQDA